MARRGRPRPPAARRDGRPGPGHRAPRGAADAQRAARHRRPVRARHGHHGAGATPPRDQDPQIISGEARFGRAVQIFTLIATLVLLAVIAAAILSIFGVFEHGSMDPPV